MAKVTRYHYAFYIFIKQIFKFSRQIFVFSTILSQCTVFLEYYFLQIWV